MGKKTIWTITSIMSVALLALLGVQWYWTQTAVAMQQQQFNQQVQNAMLTVVEELQDRELFVAIRNNAPKDGRSTQVIVQKEEHTSMGQMNIQQETRVIRIEGKENGSDSTTTLSTEVTVDRRGAPLDGAQRKVWVFQEDSLGPNKTEGADGEYALEIVQRILQNPKPLAERIDSLHLRQQLALHLEKRGITTPFEFAVHSSPLPYPATDRFVVQLFPHDLPPSNQYLSLHFPGRSSLAMQTIGVLLPSSGLLALILIGCFAFTLLVIRKQKQLGDMKTDFINNMTHELKTPIATISLAAQALQDPDMRSSGKSEEYVGLIRTETDRLRAQVERVLQSAALQTGAFPVQLQSLDLHQALKGEIERWRLIAEARQGHLVWKPCSQTPSVMGNAEHVCGILGNLIDNALKYSPENPEVEISTRIEGDKVWVEVRDQGIGMKKEALGKIYEPFYRVPTGNLHDVKGFGLGLSYVKAMVAAHGGEIRVHSQPGQGSSFAFCIPIAAQA